MSPSAWGTFVKFPTTKENCRGLLTTGANCENKIRGTVWTFLQLEKYKKLLTMGVSCEKDPTIWIKYRILSTIGGNCRKISTTGGKC